MKPQRYNPAMERRTEKTPQEAEDFRITLSNSGRASEVARIMEGPANPSNPRYDNLEVGPIENVVMRSDKGQSLKMNRDQFNDAVDAGEVYVEAKREEQDAKNKKDNAAAALIGLARRIPFFKGVGFPEDNDSATVVPVKSKSISDENVSKIVEQSGLELQEFGTEQIQLTVNVPVSLTDRKGNALTVDEFEEKLSKYVSRILRPSDKGLFEIVRKLKIHNWKKFAQLVREGKVSHELIDVDEDYVVKPIPLSQVSKSKPRTVKNPRIY